VFSFDEFMEDSSLGGYSLPDLSTYQYQLTAYRAADAMPPRPGDMDRLYLLSGRTEWPTAPCREIHNNWCRRAGKSQMNCYRAAWHATDDSHLADLARGERCKIGYTCPSKQQAMDTFNMLKGIFEAPLLAQMIERVTADCISLKNRIDLFVQPASYQTIRGGSKKAEIFDEGSFFYVDGVNNLSELLAAAAPSLATIKNSRLYLSSSVYKQVGEMPEAKRRYWGVNDGPVFVTKGDWTILRPDIDESVIDAAMERDPERARAEWYSEERTDLADAFLASWVDDAMVLPDRNIPRSVHESWNYHAFWDGSGGARDAATLSIAIQEPGRDVTTLVFHHRWPAPHSPAAVVKEASVYLKEYGCHMVSGDRYASNFMVDAFADNQISYQYSKLTRSEIYLEAIPAMATGKYELPKNEPLRREAISLQRRTRSGGRDSVDHAPGGTDDRANSAFGSLNLARNAARTCDFSILTTFEPNPFTPDAEIALQVIGARHPAPWDF
jgi:hypothetical protein